MYGASVRPFFAFSDVILNAGAACHEERSSPASQAWTWSLNSRTGLSVPFRVSASWAFGCNSGHLSGTPYFAILLQGRHCLWHTTTSPPPVMPAILHSKVGGSLSEVVHHRSSLSRRIKISSEV